MAHRMGVCRDDGKLKSVATALLVRYAESTVFGYYRGPQIAHVYVSMLALLRSTSFVHAFGLHVAVKGYVCHTTFPSAEASFWPNMLWPGTFIRGGNGKGIGVGGGLHMTTHINSRSH